MHTTLQRQNDQISWDIRAVSLYLKKMVGMVGSVAMEIALGIGTCHSEVILRTPWKRNGRLQEF